MYKAPSVTDALSVLISVLVIGIPLSLILSDTAVTWSALARTLVWAGVFWSLSQLLFIGLLTMARATNKRFRSHRGRLKGTTPYG